MRYIQGVLLLRLNFEKIPMEKKMTKKMNNKKSFVIYRRKRERKIDGEQVREKSKKRGSIYFLDWYTKINRSRA